MTNDVNAVITVDFGRSCSSGKSVALNMGDIFIGRHKIISFSTAYKDIIFVMSDCDDEVHIAETFPDTSSVEVVGNDGDDEIILGDKNRPVETLIFANIIIDGGRGNDVLAIHDQGSSATKPISVRSTMFEGFHSKVISYFGIETIDLALGRAAAQVDVYSTAKHTGLTIRTSDGDDNFRVQNVQGSLKIVSGCGQGELVSDTSVMCIDLCLIPYAVW